MINQKKRRMLVGFYKSPCGSQVSSHSSNQKMRRRKTKGKMRLIVVVAATKTDRCGRGLKAGAHRSLQQKQTNGVTAMVATEDTGILHPRGGVVLGLRKIPVELQLSLDCRLFTC